MSERTPIPKPQESKKRTGGLRYQEIRTNPKFQRAPSSPARPLHSGFSRRRQYEEAGFRITPCRSRKSSGSPMGLGQTDPEPRLAHSALGWKPVVPFEKGLENTVDYFRVHTPSHEANEFVL